MGIKKPRKQSACRVFSFFNLIHRGSVVPLLPNHPATQKQPMKEIRYWVSKVLTPEQSEVEKKPEPKHSVTEKMKFLQEQSNHQPEQKTPQQKKQDMEL